MRPTTDCPFCSPEPERVIMRGEAACAIWDKYPISPGHALIVPARHFASWFEATDRERSELMTLLDKAKVEVAASHAPDGYNIGINDGQAAGQTVAHLHLHLIPRYRGDSSDPRGGVRRIFPEKAKYW